jgi:hypothetical protein
MAGPSSFYGDVARISRLPMPGNPNAPIAEGADAIAQATHRAASSMEATDDEARNVRLQTDRITYERNLQLATGDTAAKLATMQGDLDVDLIKLREGSQPGAAGHDDAVNTRLDKFRDDAATLIGGNPDLQARFVDNIATIAASARTGEATWAATRRAKKSGDDYEALDNVIGSNIRTAVTNGTATAETLVNAARLRGTSIDAQPVDGTTKAMMKRDGWIKDNITAIQALTDVDPHAALNSIDKGALKMVPDKTVDQLREAARVAADRADNKLKEARTEAAGVTRANARNDIEDVNAAVHVPQERLQASLAKVEGSAKPEDISLAHDLKIAIAKNATTAKYDFSTQDERRSAMGQIEAHKGWQDDPMLVAAHQQLGTLIGRDDHAADADPVSLYARQTGQQLPALDLANPKAMAQRFTAADRAADRFHKPLPMVFTEAEVKQLRDQYNQATAGGKADFMLGLGSYGSARARQMMFQIAPTDPKLVRLAELSANRDPAVQSIVREAMDGSAVPMKDGVATRVRNIAQHDYGPALSRLSGDRQAAVLQVATLVYAHRAAAGGKADTFDDGMARASIEGALGGANGKGGMGNRNGASVVLPMGVTQDDFDRVLAMGTAKPETVRAAANGVPTWQGRALHQREFSQLVPVLVHDDGVIAAYAFKSRGGSGFVKNERGDDYLLDMRKLAQGLRGGFDAQLAAHGYVRR